MEFFDLFKSDILVNKVGSELDNAKLKQQMLQARNNNPNSISMSNPGCWRSSIEYNDIDWLLNGVYQTIESAIEHYTKSDITFKNGIVNKSISIEHWSNINEPGSKNVLHSHVTGTFAAVYYVQGEGTGALKFINPANTLNNCYTVSPYIREVLIEPKDGELILWPAWIPHEVEVNNSEKQRINIAFVAKVS